MPCAARKPSCYENRLDGEQAQRIFMEFMAEADYQDVARFARNVGAQYSRVCMADDRAACEEGDFEGLSPPALELYSIFERIRHRMAYEECLMGVTPRHLVDESVVAAFDDLEKCRSERPSVALAIVMTCSGSRSIEQQTLSRIKQTYDHTLPSQRLQACGGDVIVSRKTLRALASIAGVRGACATTRDRSLLRLVGSALAHSETLRGHNKAAVRLPLRLLQDTIISGRALST